MAVTDHSDLDRLLGYCALLRWFDRALIEAVTDAAPDTIDALFVSDLVEQWQPGAFRLRAELVPALRAGLRAEQPLEELALYRRAFEHFLALMQRTDHGDERARAEDDCLYYLEQLYPLLTQRLEWPAIMTAITAARAARPQHDRFRRRLTLYEGYVAVRTEDYDRGERLLTGLLDDSALEHDLLVHALLGLAQAHWYRSRYDRALMLYQRLYDAACAADDLLYQGLALLNISSVHNELEQFDQALDLSLRSLPIFRALSEPIREAHALYRIGLNAMYLGRWSMAQEYFDLAIPRFEALGISEGLALLYWCRGVMYVLLGNAAEGETAFHQALVLTSAPAYGDSYLTQETYEGLGLLYQSQGQWDAALAAYQQALALTEALQGEHWRALLNYRCGMVYERQNRIAEAESAYRAAIRDIEALRAAIETESIKIGLLGTTQQAYEALVLLLLGQGRDGEAFEFVERARSRAFLDQLVSQSPDLYGAFEEPVATLAELQPLLPDDVVLVEYYCTGVLPQGEHLLNRIPAENARLREQLTLPAQIWIFAITRATLRVARASIDPNLLRPDPRAPVPTRHLLRERLLPRLYDALIAPVVDLLTGCTLLYLLPHGPLHYLPFVALQSASGDRLLDADGPAIAFAPSATVLLRSCLRPTPRRNGEALALGYNDAGEMELLYAEAEARLVARHTGGRALVGPHSKRADLLAAAPALRMLHIAGHAYYYSDDPLSSEIHLGEDDHLNARTIVSDLHLGADLVVLSACTSGLARVASGDELLGLQRALLYAGARTIVCTLWEATDLVTLILMDRFYAALQRGDPPAVALRDAQVGLRAMTGRDVRETLARWRSEDPDDSMGIGDLPEVPPELLDERVYADPFHWAPFLLIGRPT